MRWTKIILFFCSFCIAATQSTSSTEQRKTQYYDSEVKVLEAKILLELPGEDIMNNTEILSFQNAIFDVISSPSCQVNASEINSVTISGQSLSANNKVLYLSLSVDATAEEIFHKKVVRTISECIKINGQSIKNNHLETLGYITSESNDGNSWFQKKHTLMIFIIVGSILSSLAIMMVAVYFTLKQKRKRKDVQNLPTYKSSFCNIEEHKEQPGNIQQILSSVLSGPDVASQTGSESSSKDSDEVTHKISVSNGESILSKFDFGSIADSENGLRSLRFMEKMSTESRDAGAVRRSIATHGMHSEGLTFQPIVGQSDESDDTLSPTNNIESRSVSNGTGAFQNPIDYVRAMQKMVLESKNRFFDEDDNFESNDMPSSQLSSSTSNGEYVVTNFGKRIMFACSPKR